MKRGIITILFLINAACFAQSTVHHRCASLAKGINLDNWLEPQGTPDASEFTKADFYDFIEAGYSTVRMPVRFAQYVDTVAPYHLDTTALAFELMDSVIAWSRGLGLHVIIDNHHGWESLGNSNYLDVIPRMGAMWRQLAQRYRHLHPDSLFFEIINEPSYFLADQPFVDFMQAMIDTIRQQTANHTIIVSVPWASSQVGFDYITPFADTNLIYTFHFYTPLNFTHQGATWTPVFFPVGKPFPENGNDATVRSQFQRVTDWIQQYEKPVFLGEFGVISNADSASRCNWISLLGELIYSANLSWAYWDWDSPGDINFSFFNGMDVAPQNIIACFGEALRLYGMEPSAVKIPETTEFVLLPNPAREMVTVVAENNFSRGSKTVLTLSNMIGQTLLRFPVNDAQEMFDISALPNGIYVADIAVDGAGRMRRKLCVSR